MNLSQLGEAGDVARAGVAQVGLVVETEFYWYEDPESERVWLSHQYVAYTGNTIRPAYLPCELMEVVPSELLVDDEPYWLYIEKESKGYHISFDDILNTEFKGEYFKSPIFAEALGKLLVWLGKEGLLK